MYCGHCGASVISKRCSVCGTKQGNGRGYCAWCGTALEPGAVQCPVCQEPTKKPSGFVKVLKIIGAILCFISGLAMFGQSPLCGIFFLLTGVLLLPVVRNVIQQKTHGDMAARKKLQWVRIIASALCFIIAFCAVPSTGSSAGADYAPIVDSEGKPYTEEKIKDLAIYAVGQKLIPFGPPTVSISNSEIEVERIQEKRDACVVTGTVKMRNSDGHFCDKDGNIGMKEYRFTFKIMRGTQEVYCEIK